MLLADVGNTRLKWASAEAGGLTGHGAAEHAGTGLAQVLEDAWGRLRAPSRLVVANVAGPTAAGILTGWALGRWGLTPELVVARAAAGGVRNAYPEPERLGADRWAALVGARALCPDAACVVDCGSAVTADALSAEGEHLGGLILPGLALMRHSLQQGTAGVRPAGDADVSLLARNTAGAVAGGTLYALVATVDRIASDLTAELGGRVEALLTGGDAPLLLPLLGRRWRHEPDLVLRGLAVLANEVAEGAP
ncbi:MAG: type III pantothenate kinase [Gammaproteobacteria bacterium]|jgi:type III pantothenate kinase|nr:type III pantothenate kinase [Gammaproteobacteria bacterium]